MPTAQGTMGQKRELSLEVKFTEADKECLGRLVKDLVKLGATTSKVRAFCGAAALDDYPRSALFPITFTRTHDSPRRTREARSDWRTRSVFHTTPRLTLNPKP
jgi:hypothetical protein